jgi:hypothetical protein
MPKIILAISLITLSIVVLDAAVSRSHRDLREIPTKLVPTVAAEPCPCTRPVCLPVCKPG